MAAESSNVRDLNPTEIEEICQDFWRLTQRQVEIDTAYAGLPENDPRRNLMWLDLELVLRQIGEVIIRLGACQSRQASDLRAKAAVLSSLLRSVKHEPPSPAQETLVLALSLADDVVRLHG